MLQEQAHREALDVATIKWEIRKTAEARDVAMAPRDKAMSYRFDPRKGLQEQSRGSSREKSVNWGHRRSYFRRSARREARRRSRR